MSKTSNNQNIDPAQTEILFAECQKDNPDINVILQCIENGANIHEQMPSGRYPLDQVCYNGHEAIVRLLLENGADVNAKDFWGMSPLYKACYNAHEAIVKLLLDNGANVDEIASGGLSPLNLACYNAHEAIARLLIEKGANVNQKNIRGETSLLVACDNGQEAIARLLIEKGANVNEKDTIMGWSPLNYACYKGHEAIERLLLENGAHRDIILLKSLIINEEAWDLGEIIENLAPEEDLRVHIDERKAGFFLDVVHDHCFDFGEELHGHNVVAIVGQGEYHLEWFVESAPVLK
ncbi:MAG: ankyrin repeat domain-containing protein [Rickettsiaceae bacterium]|nr:ankyrin repeat domain-containing protein [Rickettsiaceae bacterium]